MTFPIPTHPPARRLAEAMMAAQATTGLAYGHVQEAAIAYADRHHPRDPQTNNLTIQGMNAAAAYLERTTEIWDVVPN